MDINYTLFAAWSNLGLTVAKGLFSDFARAHPLILVTYLATASAHAAYIIWVHMAHPVDPPLALGLAILGGYIALAVGTTKRFIQYFRPSTSR